MIEDWRYDDGKMNERSLAMSAFVRKGYRSESWCV